MSNYFQPITCIIIVAICTFITRAIPFFLFGGKKEVPALVLYLGKILPPAVMCVLIIYCLRDINFHLASRFLPQIISVIAVILLHIWKRNNLLSIGTGTVLYMILVQFVFA